MPPGAAATVDGKPSGCEGVADAATVGGNAPPLIGCDDAATVGGNTPLGLVRLVPQFGQNACPGLAGAWHFGQVCGDTCDTVFSSLTDSYKTR